MATGTEPDTSVDVVDKGLVFVALFQQNRQTNIINSIKEKSYEKQLSIAYYFLAFSWSNGNADILAGLERQRG